MSNKDENDNDNDNGNDNDFIEPDSIFDRTFSLNLDLENKIMKKVEKMLEDNNNKIIELEDKFDKFSNSYQEIIKNKEMELNELKNKFDEFKIISDSNFELIKKLIEYITSLNLG